MMIAVIIAIGIMLWASKPLMDFVNKHPTVVILCLMLPDDDRFLGWWWKVLVITFQKAIYMPRLVSR